MRRISNSIALAKESWKVLQANKELLVLPVISGLASIFVMETFAHRKELFLVAALVAITIAITNVHPMNEHKRHSFSP